MPLAQRWDKRSCGRQATRTLRHRRGLRGCSARVGVVGLVGVARGAVLTITWSASNGWAGVYRWTLLKDCSGSGTLTFTAGSRAGQVLSSRVTGPAPAATPKAVVCRAPASVGRSSACESVKFQFVHGGIPHERLIKFGRPKSDSGLLRIVVEMATTGTGKAGLEGEGWEARRLESDTAQVRIVRKIGVALIDRAKPKAPVRDYDEYTLVLGAAGPQSREARYGRNPEEGQEIVIVDLRLVSSNDPLCPKGRAARVLVRDAGRSNDSDVISLTIAGCPHHTHVFGHGGKRIVKAVVIGPAPPA